MMMSTTQVTGFLIKETILYHAMTLVLLETSHSRSVQVRMGKSTKKVSRRKATVNPTSPPKLSLISSKGLTTPLYHFFAPLIIVSILCFSLT